MSRRARKKKTYRLKPSKTYHFWAFRLKLWMPSILWALLIPTVALLSYILLKALGVFSVYYKELHWAAWALFALWVVQAIRGAVGYWAHRAHLRFCIPMALLVLAGSCWASFQEAPIKVWVTPPAYAQLPSEALNGHFWKAQDPVLEGSQIHVSWEDESSPVDVAFNGKSAKLDFFGISEPVATFHVPVKTETSSYELFAHSGWLRYGSWRFETIADQEPQISLTEKPEITVRKTIRFAYEASDDFGVKTVVARLTPTASSLQERVRSVDVPLRAPLMKDIKTTSYVDLTSLPWAGIPVMVQLMVEDGAGQKGWSAPKVLTLPSRRFHNPFARALIEERERLLRQPDGAMRDEAANVMAGIARQQSLFNGDPVVMMSLRAGAVRLVVNNAPETVQAVGSVLWQAAIRLEEGPVGLARHEFAQAERNLSLALMHKEKESALHDYLGRIDVAMKTYFDALEKERAKQPVSLREVDWPLTHEEVSLSPEDVKEHVEIVRLHLKEGDHEKAKEKLALLQDVIENLRTTPPELTPAQALIARQVAALRALVRGQTDLIAVLDPLTKLNRKTRQGQKKFKNGLAHQVGQQKLLLSSLHEVITQSGLRSLEAKAGEVAMNSVIKALKTKELQHAREKQAEALALLENSLLTLTEQMRRSMAAKAN